MAVCIAGARKRRKEEQRTPDGQERTMKEKVKGKKEEVRGDGLKEELILWNHLEEIQVEASQRHRRGLMAAGDQDASPVYL